MIDEETEFEYVQNNNNIARSNRPMNSLPRMASDKGRNCFNIFLSSAESKSIPHRDPRVKQTQLKEKITHSGDIDGVRVNRAGSIIIKTNLVEYAVDAGNILKFLGVLVTKRIIWENVTNRFFLF